MVADSLLCDAERPPERPVETDPLLPKQKTLLTESSLSLWSTPSICKCVWQLRDEYGSEVLWLIAAGLWFMRGLIGSMQASVASFIYKDYHVNATQNMIYTAVTLLPWSMKPVFGLVSDAFPIRGLNRFPYAAVVSVLGLGSMMAVGITSIGSMSAWVFTACLFLCNTFQAFISVLIQGMYSASLQRGSPDESLRSNLVTFDHAGTAVGVICGALFVGFMLSFCHARQCFIVLLVPTALVTGWMLRVFLAEKRKDSAQIEACWKHFQKQPELLFLCMFILVANVIILITNMMASNAFIVGVVAVSVILAMAVAFAVLLTPAAAGIVCFIAIVSTSNFEVAGATFYFCTDSAIQYPAGPHLSPVFYTGVPIVQGVFWLIGSLTYSRFSRGWTYKRWLPMMTFAVIFARVPKALFYSRLNLVLGVSDQTWMIAAEAMEGFIAAYIQIPLLVAISTLCPHDLETTVAGILMGTLNLSVSASSSLGGLVLHAMGVNPSGSRHESAEFDRLWMVVAMSPLMAFVAALVLSPALPDKVIGASLIDTESGSITNGSPWKRWRRGNA